MRNILISLSVLTLSMSTFLAGGCDDDGSSDDTDASGDTDTLGSMGGAQGDGSVDTNRANGGSDAGGDASGDAAPNSAHATLTATSAVLAGDAGVSMAAGTVTFTKSGNNVTVQINVTNTPAGDHGLHIHMNPSCTDTPAAGDAGAVPAGGAGTHWNPTAMNHGVVNSDGGMHHAGDLGNITVAANGTGSKTLTISEWTVGDVVGHAVVLHAATDDLVTNPTGNSGARIGCGVITAN